MAIGFLKRGEHGFYLTRVCGGTKFNAVFCPTLAADSVEIVGWGSGPGEMKRLDVPGLYRDDAVLVLQHPLDDEERIVDDCSVIFFKELRRDDDIGDAGFIFQA